MGCTASRSDDDDDDDEDFVRKKRVDITKKKGPSSQTPEIHLVMLMTIFNFILAPTPPAGPGGGSGLPVSLGNRWCLAGSWGLKLSVILILA